VSFTKILAGRSQKEMRRAGIKEEPLEVEKVLLFLKNKTIELTSPTCVKVTIPGQGTFYQVYYGVEKESDVYPMDNDKGAEL
jgi:NACalpha-BTF3-like transcription factor